MVEVGDRVELASAKVERRPRSGVVTAVRGLMITVRWDTGQQSTVVPASGTLSVLGRDGERQRQGREPSGQGGGGPQRQSSQGRGTRRRAGLQGTQEERWSGSQGRRGQRVEGREGGGQSRVQGGRAYPQVAEASEVTEPTVATHPWAAPA